MELPGKHIVFIVENLSVPFDRRVWREASALKNAGYNVSVICPKGQSKETEKYISINGINIYRYDIPHIQSSKAGYIKEYSKAFFSSIYLILKISFRNRIHAIHVANPPEIFFPLGWLGKLMRFKFIFDHHDLSPETYLCKFGKKDTMYKILVKMEKLTFKTSDFVFSTNESIQKLGIERNKYTAVRTAVVRNGPDKEFQLSKSDENLKKGKKFLAAYIGIMGVMDGVENIIKAADYIVNVCKYCDIYFILMGFGDEYENLKKLVKLYKLKEFISMPGMVYGEEIKVILTTADVCLAPDPKNGLNEFLTMNKIMDYMRFGKPIVSFDLFETEFSAKNSAVYVENNDPIGFANAIIELLKDPKKMKEMGSFGIERVDKILKWEYFEKVLLNKYSEILA
ncbi:glycosyltransferase family 4 protein [soil metagenome]